MFRSFVRFSSCMAVAVALVAMAPHAFADKTVEQDLSKGGLDQEGGTIKGTVVWVGDKDPTPRAPVNMAADAYCKGAHDGPVATNTVVISEDGKIANTLIFIHTKFIDSSKYKAPSKSMIMDQVGCRYSPHIGAVMAGQTITIHNSDQTMHNVRMSSKDNGEFNKASPPGTTLEAKLDKAEPAVPFKCDVHPWMASFVHVLPHPFFAVTNEKGEFEIKGLPDGKYGVVSMHEYSRRMVPKQKGIVVTIKDGQTEEIKFEYDLKK